MWIFPHKIKEIPLSGAPTCYAETNKSGKAEDLSKVADSPQKSVQKS